MEATTYELEQLRCNGCGQVFTAEAPAEAGEEKYDERAAAMIALLRYGSGVPFQRLERLEANLGIPMPAATQWEVVEEKAESLRPALEELIRQAKLDRKEALKLAAKERGLTRRAAYDRMLEERN